MVISGTTVEFCNDRDVSDCAFAWIIGGDVDASTITAEGVIEPQPEGGTRTRMLIGWDLLPA